MNPVIGLAAVATALVWAVVMFLNFSFSFLWVGFFLVSLLSIPWTAKGFERVGGRWYWAPFPFPLPEPPKKNGGKKKKKNNKEEEEETPSGPAQTPKKKKRNFFPLLVGAAVIALLAVTALVGLSALSSSGRKTTAAKQAAAQEKERRQAPTPVFGGWTPCEFALDFPFHLETGGISVSLSFPGVPTPVKYSGRGPLTPEELKKIKIRKSGPVKITSLNPEEKAWVQVWRIWP